MIPARGGSKRIVKKNIRNFLGRPIIHYAIDAAKRCGLFDDIIVSTDCAEIAAVARQGGAATPFVRPSHLADDFTGTQAVMQHALQALEAENKHSDYACCIYATSPLLCSDRLCEGFDKLQHRDCDFVVSAVSFEFPIQRALQKQGAWLVPLQPEAMGQRSQDLAPMYHDAAQFYWGRRDAFVQQRPLWGGKTQAVILPAGDVQDIDTPEDWQMAELKYRLKQAARGTGGAM